MSILREAYKQGTPVSVLGGGTNTLAADRGIKGIVVHLGRAFQTLETLDEAEDAPVRVRCGASLCTQQLAAAAARRGWARGEALAGLPGQIGGAIAMNAQSIGSFVEEITLVSPEGDVHLLRGEQLRFAYRHTVLPPGIIVEALFRFERAPTEEVASAVREVVARRNATQDVLWPSAGCAFRNPQGAAAGQLIEQAQLKGSRIGDAQVSFRHGNFIVNLGYARCDDVLALMEYVRRQVDRTFGITLEPEVRVLGEAL